MKSIKLIFPGVVAAFAVLTLALSVKSQQPAPQQAASRYDITHYRIEAQIIPDQHILRAGADISFVPLDATRSVVFELNGSLKITSIQKDGQELTGFVQDAVGVGSLGPSVRVDLGQVVPANQPVTLRVRWEGALVSPEGECHKLRCDGVANSSSSSGLRSAPFRLITDFRPGTRHPGGIRNKRDQSGSSRRAFAGKLVLPASRKRERREVRP